MPHLWRCCDEEIVAFLGSALVYRKQLRTREMAGLLTQQDGCVLKFLAFQYSLAQFTCEVRITVLEHFPILSDRM